MTVMTRKSQALLDQLIAIAGDADTVEAALRSLNEESDSPPELRDIVRRILELLNQRNHETHATR